MKRVAAIIPASNRNRVFPEYPVGAISGLKRLVMTLKKCQVEPIVVITGFYENELKSELAYEGVIFIPNDPNGEPSLWSSVLQGVRYLHDKADQIIVAPVNYPLFLPSTLKQLLMVEANIIVPSYANRGGHPMLLHREILPLILQHDGEDGLRGAANRLKGEKRYVTVEDPGICWHVSELDAIDPEALEEHIKRHNQELFQPIVDVKLRREAMFFDNRTRLLLEHIAETGSVLQASRRLSMSRSTAWKLIHVLENEVNFMVVERRHGGAQGGKSRLTPNGARFLDEYRKWEFRVRQYAEDEFSRFVARMVDEDSDRN